MTLRHRTGPGRSPNATPVRPARRTATGGIERLEDRAYLTATFAGPTNHPGVVLPTAIASADFTGGTTADVAVAGYAPSATTIPVVGVYLPTAGTFGTPTINAFSGQAAGLATGDFLGNGEQDVAVLDSSTNQMQTFISDGQGDFTPGQSVSLPGTGGDTAVVPADFNGDGETDLAVVDPAENQVVVELSAGDGTFAQVATVPVPSPVAVAAVDLNGDGLTDLAVLSSNGSVYVALAQPGRRFAAPVAYSLGAADAVPASFVAVDLNGDSRPDLAVVGSASAGTAGAVSVLLNQGTGTFGTATAVAAVAADPTSILSGNFTDSAHTDLAVLDAGGGLAVIPGNGDGTFGAVQQVFTTQLHPTGGAIAVDLNGDGVTDIAYPDAAAGGFSELIDTTGGTVTPASPLVPKLTGSLPTVSLVAGQSAKAFHQTVTLTNGGSATVSGKTTVTLTLSATAAGATGDPVVATAVIPHLSLKAGKASRVTLTIRSIPAGLDGAYYVRATVVDPSSGTRSAASAGTVDVVPATVNLSGAFVATPTSVKVGHGTSVTVSVANLGTVAATGSLTVTVTATPAAGTGAPAVPFATFTTRVSIKPGHTVRVRVPATVPANIPSPFDLAATAALGGTPTGVTVTDAAFVGKGPITVAAG
jgi:hypothetical protein